MSGMFSANRVLASLQRFGADMSFSLCNDSASFMWQVGLVWCSLNISYIAFSSRQRLFLSGLILRHLTYVHVILRKPPDIMGSNSYRHIEWISSNRQQLTLKHRETHGCVVSTVATDKAPGHQYPQCWLYIHCIGQVSSKNITLMWTTLRSKITFLKNMTQSFRC